MKSKLISIAALGTASALATWTVHAQVQNQPLNEGLKEGFTYDWVEKQYHGETLQQTSTTVQVYRKDGSSVVVIELRAP